MNNSTHEIRRPVIKLGSIRKANLQLAKVKGLRTVPDNYTGDVVVKFKVGRVSYSKSFDNEALESAYKRAMETYASRV